MKAVAFCDWCTGVGAPRLFVVEVAVQNCWEMVDTATCKRSDCLDVQISSLANGMEGQRRRALQH